MIDPKMKSRIDAMSYEDLLYNWRFSPSGNPLFEGEVGDYYAARMKQKREEVGNGEAVAASKRIGWER